MTVLAEYGPTLLILACAFGVLMAWGVGANDVANAMGTSVGSKALTIRQAIVVAMVFEFLGAYLAGGSVTATVRSGIVDPTLMTETPELLVYGMLAALLAAGTWLLIAMVTLLKGLKHVLKNSEFSFSFAQSALISAAIGVAVMLVGIAMLRLVQPDQNADAGNRFASVEKVFGVLMIFTACAMAFAHGSNDVANAVGPLAAVVSIVSTQSISTAAPVPPWVLLLGAAGIVIGLATYGYKVIATIGRKITELTPSRGFAAELGAAGTVVLGSGTGLPVSTTQTLVGAVLGVGLARGIGALNLRVVGTVFMSWVITLPAGAGLAILFFFFFKGVFGG